MKATSCIGCLMSPCSCIDCVVTVSRVGAVQVVVAEAKIPNSDVFFIHFLHMDMHVPVITLVVIYLINTISHYSLKNVKLCLHQYICSILLVLLTLGSGRFFLPHAVIFIMLIFTAASLKSESRLYIFKRL